MNSSYRVLTGLGSPNKENKNNRQNIGLVILDNFIEGIKIKQGWKTIPNSTKLLEVNNLTIVKPLTDLKNLPKELVRFQATKPSIGCEMIIICEDVNLKLGLYEYCDDKHKEKKDIFKKIGENFSIIKLIKIGVGNGVPHSKTELNKNFTNDENLLLHPVKHQVVEDLKILYVLKDFNFLKEKNLQHLNHKDRYLIHDLVRLVKKIHLQEVLNYVENNVEKEYQQSAAIILNNLKLKEVFNFGIIESLKNTLSKEEQEVITIKQLLNVYQNCDLMRGFYKVKHLLDKTIPVSPNIKIISDRFVSGLKLLKTNDLNINNSISKRKK